MTSALFRPLDLRDLRLANRIMVSPMCQYSATDGNAGDWHLSHYMQLAAGGAGLLCIEATAVEAIGRITPGCLGLYSDENEAALARMIAAVRRHADTPLACQLAHAGRKASSQVPWDGGAAIPAQNGGWQTIAPSAVAISAADPSPRKMDGAELTRVRNAFAQAARRAARRGFDAIELHSAHGYLLHEFLSPIVNRRQDDYGGSLQNRIRFPLEVFAAVREAWPAEKPLGVRISTTDWVDGGWDLAQSVEYARRLKALGCDWIDASSGGVSPLQEIVLGPDYQVPFAHAIRQQADIATIAVGLITQPQQADAIIQGEKADLVAIGRGMLFDPHWPWRGAAALGAQVRAPKQYWRAAPRSAKGLFGEGAYVSR